MTLCSPLCPFPPSLHTGKKKKKIGKLKLHQGGLKICFGQAALTQKEQGPSRSNAEVTTPVCPKPENLWSDWTSVARQYN